MTFLNTRYRLMKMLTQKQYENLAGIASRYGIRNFWIEGENLVVEYDASRMHEAEVLVTLRKAGIPVAPLQPIAPGAFDYTGEFRDFAWPVQGLSPANRAQK